MWRRYRKLGQLVINDEDWWMEIYTPMFEQPNCIVGESLMVHLPRCERMTDRTRSTQRV